MLQDGEWVVGDAGYRDDWQFVIAKKTGTKEIKDLTAMVCARHETVNSRYRFAEITRIPFRHGKGRHGTMMKSLTNVVQVQLKLGNGLYQLDDYDDMFVKEHIDLINMNW